MTRSQVASGEHTVIVDEPDALARQLSVRVAAGELVVRESARLPDGRAYARVEVVRRSRLGALPRRRGVVVAVAVAVAAVAAVSWLVVAVLFWAAAHWAPLLGAVIVLVAAWLVVGRRMGVCVGVHCPGCGH